MPITPTGAPHFAGENDHATYGGNLDKSNWRGQPAVNNRTDLSAEQFVRLTEDVAACSRVSLLCTFLLNVSSKSTPYPIDWIRFAACRVGYRQSLVIRENWAALSGLDIPPPVPERNYLLYSTSPFDGNSPPDADPIATTESNGLPLVGSVSGGFSFLFALDYCDQFGRVNATNIRYVRSYPQSTTIRVTGQQMSTNRSFVIHTADIAGTEQVAPLLVEVYASNE